MSKLRFPIVFVSLAFAPLSSLVADPCRIDFLSHGTFRVVQAAGGECLQFVDDLGVSWEVTNPRGSWKDGMTGTIEAEFLSSGVCTAAIGDPLRACAFTADFSRNVVGKLVFRQFVECPGYRIATRTEDYRIVNCDDFGTELCAPENLGRRLQAQIFVDTGVTICIDSTTTVVDFRFLQ